jgi:hypothetical protein
MAFYDKNGTQLSIGDTIIPDEGRALRLVSEGYLDELGQDCLFGQQVDDLMAFSVLTQENLSLQWTKADAL